VIYCQELFDCYWRAAGLGDESCRTCHYPGWFDPIPTPVRKLASCASLKRRAASALLADVGRPPRRQASASPGRNCAAVHPGSRFVASYRRSSLRTTASVGRDVRRLQLPRLDTTSPPIPGFDLVRRAKTARTYAQT